MNEITTPVYQRQIADVTRDIRIQTGQFLRTAIEIGRLLFEAKAMVEPGGWSKYIEEELPFSHSWANNYMKLYKEYGSDQTSLFGDSQAFMNLRPTQALELLALPADAREEFVQTHDVEDMSTRQLRQEVQTELEAERRLREQAQADLEETEANLRDANHKLLLAQQESASVKSKESEYKEQLNELNVALQKAKDTAKNNKQLLADAQARETAAREELKKLQENPQVPESMMEQLRAEVEADAAKKAAEEARKAAAASDAALKDAQDRADAAEKKLEEIQKAAKIANPDIMSINALGNQIISTWNTIKGHRMKAVAADPANAAPINNFLTALIQSMQGEII